MIGLRIERNIERFILIPKTVIDLPKSNFKLFKMIIVTLLEDGSILDITDIHVYTGERIPQISRFSKISEDFEILGF